MEVEGEEAKKKKKKKKGIKASEYGDSGASNPLVFSLLSNFFFFSPADFLLPAETHRYSADTIRFGPVRLESARFGASRRPSEPNRRESARIRKRKKKKKNWTWFDAQAAASPARRRVGLRRTWVRRPFCRVRASWSQTHKSQKTKSRLRGSH